MKVRSAATLVLPVLVLSGVARSASQRATVELDALTVPENHLPAGCRLQPTEAPQAAAETGRGARVVTFNALFPTNPWIGRERGMVAMIARLVDDAESPQPDGPPLNARQAAEFQQRWAEGIVEAYRAAYAWRDGSEIQVVAVRFEDEKRARAVPASGAWPWAGGQTTSRLVIGLSVARLSAPGGINSCFEAIRNHIESLR